MNEDQSKKNWEDIPHMKIGEIPPSIIEGPVNTVSLLVAKRLLLATTEDAEDDPEQAMQDVVANLMMLCCYMGIDFESILSSARDYHRGETNLVEIVPKAVFEARSMPGHYHLEFTDDEEFEGDAIDDETKYFNATLEECMQKVRETDRVLVRAYFVCQFGCGQEHALSDNERILLGLRPLKAGLGVWGGTDEEAVEDLLTAVSDTGRPS